MNRLEEIQFQTESSIKSINDYLEMNNIYGICENKPSIEASNKTWNYYLTKAKEKAFEQIRSSVVFHYVVYRVNKYFQTK